ncbi:MAG: histidine phosphatase family protein [Saprospiraceae bacterium]|uniref:Histidine phosphatase family protein n=1 Tax=Candidatus Defluviibacterium haderslevense TaxID=2981993 RepID=A0A9D7S8U2_9BACT|nr:histidine phosphatase family protein [Candidatus Defluviibacterium haderslevense]
MKKLLLSACFILIGLFNIQIWAQGGSPALNSIRGAYFVSNDAKDSVFSKDLKNPSVQTIYLLLHAEIDSIGLDPGLTSEGRWRAIKLIKLFKEREIKAFFTTPFRRNILTLQPIVDSYGKEVIYYDNSDLKSFYKQLDLYKNGDFIVIVDKSYVKEIIANLTMMPFTENLSINSSEDFFVVQKFQKEKPKFWRFKY